MTNFFFYTYAFFVIYLELLGQCVLYALGVAACWLGIIALERSLRIWRARRAIYHSRTKGTWLIIRDRRRRPSSASSSLRNTSTDR